MNILPAPKESLRKTHHPTFELRLSFDVMSFSRSNMGHINLYQLLSCNQISNIVIMCVYIYIYIFFEYHIDTYINTCGFAYHTYKHIIHVHTYKHFLFDSLGFSGVELFQKQAPVAKRERVDSTVVQ